MAEASHHPGAIDGVLIASGKYHDIDFARLELLKLLAEDANLRIRVFEDYANLDAIRNASFLVTYTCDVVPSLEQQEALRAWVEQGGRWYALHGTSSILRFLSNGLVDSPDWAPHLMETLGSQFIAHPPIAPYRVEVADADHALVRGIEPFDVTDELYLSDTRADLHVLLDAQFEGEAAGFARSAWLKDRHPVFYLRTIGKGAVLYLTLGHCRGHHDMRPLMEHWPEVQRCAWELPVFYELLRRGISWSKEAAPIAAQTQAGGTA
ncbi:ThuA domain-containing protein [Pseudoduganella sp. LjRoot289]|uniref:ThuA domain-containing protein n=1 Tax=Pseudoduganella sp. LjRoot289 TaxID=3342314 RepID=UPI003ECD7700